MCKFSFQSLLVLLIVILLIGTGAVQPAEGQNQGRTGGKRNSVQRQGLSSKHKVFGAAGSTQKKWGGGKYNARQKKGFTTDGFYSKGARNRDWSSGGGGKRSTLQKKGLPRKRESFRESMSASRKFGGGKLNDRQKKGVTTDGFYSRTARGRNLFSGGKQNTLQHKGISAKRGATRELLSDSKKWGGGKMNDRQKGAFKTGGLFPRNTHRNNLLSGGGGKRTSIERKGLSGRRGTFHESMSMNRKWGGGKMNDRQKSGMFRGGFINTGMRRDRDSFSRRVGGTRGGTRFSSSRGRVVARQGIFTLGAKGGKDSYSRRISGNARGTRFSKGKGRVVSKGGFLMIGQKRYHDSFSSRAQGKRGHRYSKFLHRVVKRGGYSFVPRARGGRDSFGVKRKGNKSTFRYSSGKRRVVTKKQLLLFSPHKRDRSHDGFSAKRKTQHHSYAYSKRNKRVTGARNMFNFIHKRERTRDSFSAPPHRTKSSYAYNKKHRRVQYVWNPLRPKRERESSSFGGRKLKRYKHYVFDPHKRQIKHRRGFFFQLFDKIQNKPYKSKKKKDKQLELWDPKLRRHMKGGD